MLAACLGGADTDALAPSPPPSIEVSAIDAGSVSEGDIAVTLVFEFQLSEASANDINVTYETRNGTAESGADYIARSGSATITAGQLSTNIAITVIDDSLDEPDEMFFVDISSPSEGVVAIASGAGNIIDEDAAPSVSIADASLTEGNAGQADLVIPLSLSAPSGFDVTVDYSTANVTATAGADYVAATGQVSIPAGATSATINVGVIADVIDENNETFSVSLDAVANAAISVGAATGTIVDDDDTVPPMVIASIAAAGTVSENPGGSSLTFPVTISMTSSADVTEPPRLFRRLFCLSQAAMADPSSC